MSQSDVIKRIEEICKEFDDRVIEVGLPFARLELAKALAENEAAQQSAQQEDKPKCLCPCDGVYYLCPIHGHSPR